MGNAIKRKKKDKLQVDEEAHSGWLDRAAHLGISDEQEAPFEPGKADLSKAKILKVMDVVLSIPDEIREVYEQFYDIVVAPGMEDVTRAVLMMGGGWFLVSGERGRYQLKKNVFGAIFS